MAAATRTEKDPLGPKEVPVDALDPSDPRRQAFGRLHGLSVMWMGVGGLAALLALILIARVISTRTAP